jgi:molybdopterin/thiamine biosynthesis adenylyltransferase
MPEIADPSLSAAQSAFTEGLLALAFEEDGATKVGPRYVGDVEYEDSEGSLREEAVQVVVPPDFPYQRPVVFTTTGAEGLSWHRWLDQSLCLWANDASVAHLPWRDPAVLVARARTWLTSAAGKWVDDLPVLDLERYFPQDGTLFEFDSSEFDFRGGGVFKCGRRRVAETDVYSMESYLGRIPMQRGRRGLYGFAIDVGILDAPPASWDDLVAGISNELRVHVRDVVRYHKYAIVVVRYERLGLKGETVLLLKRVSGTIQIGTALTPVPSGRAIRTLRGGAQFGALNGKRVAVVGVGAIGSFVADLLVRSGVGEISLYDSDILRPGNAIRHLCALKTEELLPKVEAVRDRLLQYGFVSPGSVSAFVTAVGSTRDARAILDHHDVVIDATASGGSSTMIADLARPDAPVVAVALERSGGVVRIDVYPGDEARRPAPIQPLVHDGPLLIEPGCGDPISPTAPAAVEEAAVWLVRVAESLLVGGSEFPTSLVVVAIPQEDQPFTQPGLVEQWGG